MQPARFVMGAAPAQGAGGAPRQQRTHRYNLTSCQENEAEGGGGGHALCSAGVQSHCGPHACCTGPTSQTMEQE